MAYNSSKGPQQHGDVKYEGDPLDTQVDFENDFIALKTNGEQRFIVSGSFITSSIPISCSVGITASAYVGDGSGLTNMTGISPISIYNSAADNRVITSVNSTTVQGEANLTHDGAILKSIGQISASLGVSGSTGHFRILNASSIVGGSPLDISASSVTITGSLTFSGSSTISASAGFFTTVTASSATVSALTASAVSGGSPISIYGDTITMVGGGAGSTTITSAHLSSSLSLSASSIHAQTTSSFLGPVGIGITLPLYDLHVNGPGSTVATIDGGSSSDAFLKFATNAAEKAYLKLGAGGNFLMTHDATGGDIILQAKPGGVTTTYLTLDGGRSALTASVAVSASHGITAGSLNTLTTIVDGLHISSSLNISGSKFYGDGSTLSGITASPAGSTTQIQYNNAGSFAGSAALTLVNGGLNTNILTASAAALISGSLDVSGSVRGKQLVYTTHAFTDGGGSPYNGYLPFHELTENTNADYRHQMQAPFNGTLKKIVFRPKNAQNGAVTLELWIAGQGDQAIDNGVIAESVTVTMGSAGSTSADFVLSGSSLLVANDIVGIKYTANAAPGNTNVTCIWEYDTLGF